MPNSEDRLFDQLGASDCASSGPARHADAGPGLLAAGPDEATLEASAPVDRCGSLRKDLVSPQQGPPLLTRQPQNTGELSS